MIPIHIKIVAGTAVRMPVNEGGPVVAAQQVQNCIFCDIHDLDRLCLLRFLASRPHCFDFRAPYFKWFGQEDLLPGFGANLRAKTLIINVVGAQRIPVHQQSTLSIQVNQRRIRKQGELGEFGEALADEEVAVAVHEIDFCAAVCNGRQRFDDLAIQAVIDVIVADPVFE